MWTRFSIILHHQKSINFANVRIVRLKHINSSDSSVKTQSPKITKSLEKITLISDKQRQVTSLEEAKKLAKRRDLHLVQVETDTKNQRPIYKLVTAADILTEELNDVKAQASAKSSAKKSEKSLTLSARIAEHDLASRLKNISKWLAKDHEVRILIQTNPENPSSTEKILKTIEEHIKISNTTAPTLHKQSKGSMIKLTIVPVTATTSSDEGQS